jgi:hypothetical protein
MPVPSESLPSPFRVSSESLPSPFPVSSLVVRHKTGREAAPRLPSAYIYLIRTHTTMFHIIPVFDQYLTTTVSRETGCTPLCHGVPRAAATSSRGAGGSLPAGVFRVRAPPFPPPPAALLLLCQPDAVTGRAVAAAAAAPPPPQCCHGHCCAVAAVMVLSRLRHVAASSQLFRVS